MGKPRIRPIALGLIQHQGHVFVSKGYDSIKDKPFYRFLGGGIDFGETSVNALKREFQEEIQADLINIRYLTCLDNIFVCNGKPGHELIQLFRCDFADSIFYRLDQTYKLIEGQKTHDAVWIPINQVRSGILNLVPNNCHAYID
ncbi:NUDIX domain-containing protein [Leptolyngbyaceae cyanobacterium CCMR0082]|uniref:NUDIX domain-containing protein n=2 Tax=Adonisia turfae TaxID=2950184 RepID=A0A6M0S4C7_9CYAN|nr:NUDIX domain-containing protein [Adonisia turfae]NEZ55640.1 NUDIX domain-containing protein [Adonisia turfae CCMR0081]NEZ63379.1 NUDIX domain-containing protein [Adonisia turfae CCMR0082]